MGSKTAINWRLATRSKSHSRLWIIHLPIPIRRILTFLIPLRMMKGSFPAPRLLARFPALEGLYGPFIQSIRQGNIAAFDKALHELESRLVQLNVWLIIVKAREIVIGRVFKKWRVPLCSPS